MSVEERSIARQLGGDYAKREYVIRGETSEADARSALLAYLTVNVSTVNGWKLDARSCAVEEIADDIFIGTGYWRNPSGQPQTAGEETETFDTTGGTAHITQAFSTISRTAASGTAPDHKGAIGVAPDGTVEGVDVVVAQYSFTIRKIVAASSVDNTFKNTIFGLTGKVNSDTFKNLSAGECLFLGAVGQTRADGDWDITYYFAALPNRTSISIGGGLITVPAKKGFEHLWVEYEVVEDTTSKTVTRRPRAAYVEQIYETGAFSALGL